VPCRGIRGIGAAARLADEQQVALGIRADHRRGRLSIAPLIARTPNQPPAVLRVAIAEEIAIAIQPRRVVDQGREVLADFS